MGELVSEEKDERESVQESIGEGDPAFEDDVELRPGDVAREEVADDG